MGWPRREPSTPGSQSACWFCSSCFRFSPYLATHALGEFRLSFWRFGPTELRILLAVGNLALLWKPRVHFLGAYYRLFDLGGTIGLAGMTLMLFFFTGQNTLRLYREERIFQ